MHHAGKERRPALYILVPTGCCQIPGDRIKCILRYFLVIDFRLMALAPKGQHRCLAHPSLFVRKGGLYNIAIQESRDFTTPTRRPKYSNSTALSRMPINV